MMEHSSAVTHARFEIRFQSLFHVGRALAFPCDCGGRVNLDALSERLKHNYLFAQAMIGREFATPLLTVNDRR
jgi:hypothetical protein